MLIITKKIRYDGDDIVSGFDISSYAVAKISYLSQKIFNFPIYCHVKKIPKWKLYQINHLLALYWIFSIVGLFSVVTIILEQKSDNTLLKLSQTGVPDYDTVRTETGWKQHFWGPMKQVFGFGAQLF